MTKNFFRDCNIIRRTVLDFYGKEEKFFSLSKLFPALKDTINLKWKDKLNAKYTTKFSLNGENAKSIGGMTGYYSQKNTIFKKYKKIQCRR